MNQQLFDYDTAVARVGGKQHVFVELAARFVEYCPERIVGLHEAARSGDLDGAGRIANVLRGVLAVLSADGAHAAARELAICCAAQDPVAMRGAAEILIHELRALDLQLRRVIRSAA